VFKLIMLAIPFIKELFFDRKEEADFNSPHFNMAKWLRFVGFVSSFFLAVFATKRLIGLSAEHISLTNSHSEIKIEVDKKQVKIMELTEKIKEIEEEKAKIEKNCHPKKKTD
jgi:hypothetical protein